MSDLAVQEMIWHVPEERWSHGDRVLHRPTDERRHAVGEAFPSPINPPGGCSCGEPDIRTPSLEQTRLAPPSEAKVVVVCANCCLAAILVPYGMDCVYVGVQDDPEPMAVKCAGCAGEFVTTEDREFCVDCAPVVA